MPSGRITVRRGDAERNDYELVDSDGKPIGWCVPREEIARLTRKQGEAIKRLSSQSLSEHGVSVDREIARRMKVFMEETGADAAEAFSRVLSSDRDLARRYREAHAKQG